ncbi:NAD-dependent epimerase/dehydratase family protein [Nocardia yunnanensis]|uniref:NAD-dependent epimerase/dehydratase family protein n=1 Tax=Nocardia yunnanensis TaxID=2382165 RepID=A0A386ZD03_9NOCA|nr:NmrA family NAD(P)-binding protein [Nocardia yunnanensis]AYF75217.1 NAD-dependent epimerase/dehydratase family protein [Nocardia yunnanensis]
MSSRNDLILVTGATGKQGGATARRLLSTGHRVRVLVRDPEAAAARELASAGAELAVGDFDEPASLSAALRGAGSAFLMPPAAFGPNGWDVSLEVERGTAFLAAARAAGVGFIVFTTVATLDADGTWGAGGKRHVEAALRNSGLHWTILRPVRFFENYLQQNLPFDGIDNGVNRHLFPADQPIQSIAVDDIAVFAQLAFDDPARFHGQILELAGDARPMPEAAAVVGAAIGQPVRYEVAPESEAEAFGPEVAAAWRLSRRGQHWHADIRALREIHPGLRTLEDWLAETGAARLKSLLTSR